MFVWLIKNYLTLRQFINIQINPFEFILNGLKWKVSYKMSYNNLTLKQKYLSDQFTDYIRVIDSSE